MTHWFSISMSMLRYISSVSAYTCGGFSYVAYIQQSTHNTSATHSLTLSCAFTPHAVQRIQCERSLRNIVLVRGACTKQAATEMVPKARIAARWRPYCVLLVASSGRIDCFCCPMGHRCFFIFVTFFTFFNVFLFSKRFLFLKTLAKFRTASRLTRSTFKITATKQTYDLCVE